MMLTDLFGNKVKLLTSCLILILALGIPVPALAAGASLDQWQPRNPLPTGANLLAVTYGNNMFVAVGDGGAIVASPDGVTWARRHLGGGTILNAVAYGNNTFVAVGSGDHDQILTSPDGVTWTAHSLDYQAALLGGQQRSWYAH
jgi:hypothetical protein